jgi:hypothetical protein
MKKHVLLFWLVLSLLSVALNAQTVYITKTGEKYHSGNCRYLSHSKFPIALKDALAQGYQACKVCKPTQSITSGRIKEEPSLDEKHDPETTNAIASQCTATTQKGNRCKRMTKSSTGKCWQHGGS